MRKRYPRISTCLRACWRLARGRCPLCNSHPARAWGCYVCCADLIAWRFRWRRWKEEVLTT